MTLARAQCKRCVAVLVALAFAASPALSSQDGHEFIRLLGFELNTVTLDDVQHRLGAAPIVEESATRDHESGLCYATAATVVRFLSAEPGGDVRELLGFSIADKTSENVKNCLPLPAAAGSLQTGGLHLGMTRSAFSAAVGDNEHWEGDVARRFFPVSPSSNAPELSSLPKTSVAIVARFAGDRLVEFKVWKLRSD